MDLSAMTELSKKAAKAAGDKIMEIYANADFGVELKEDNSPLTKADQAAHQVIVEALERTDLPILSEEGKDIPYEIRKNWEYFWLVDPLDGTKEFIKRNGEFTVNIALIYRNNPILGVVYAPVLGWMYWGSMGNGAWKQERETVPIRFQNREDVEVKSIVASRSHLSKETEAYIDQYAGAEVISMGSSLKFMLIAEGKAQIYPRFAPTMEWDTAAAQAIVEASGRQVLTYPDLMPMKYNMEEMRNGWFLVR
jgi:3'(2'), 5'-bisphosphate nucleotidase